MGSHGHGHAPDLRTVDKNSLYLRAPTLQLAALIMLVLGLVALGFGFFRQEGDRVWGAIIFNTFFFFCVGLGGMILSTCTDVIGATWQRPIRRVQEAFGSFVPVGSLIFVALIICIAFHIGGADKVYSWIEKPDMLHHFVGKRSWLVPNFFFVRVILALAILSGIVMFQLRSTTRRDRLWMDGRYDEAATFGDEYRVKSRFWSAPSLLLIGVVFTFLAFDITMSLAPTWLSTLWGGWSFAVMMQTLMAATLIVMFALKHSAIGAFWKRQQFHDIGKLMHGFTVFFAYLTFAHILTYWYGNMPEETEYFIHRLHSPWVYLLFVVFFCAFVIPLYALIPLKAKWTVWWTVPVSVLILAAQWVTNLILVMPEVIKPEQIVIPYVELGGFLAVFGLFIFNFLMFARKHPMIPVADPLLEEALHGGH